MSSSEKHLYEFGEFRLDTAERLLLRNGKPVSLPPKVFDTLVVLIQHSGHLLDKEQLMKEAVARCFCRGRQSFGGYLGAAEDAR